MNAAAPIPAFTEADVTRFMDKIGYEPESGCWPWRGRVAKTGYGFFWLSGRQVLAHRFAFVAAGNDLPLDVQLDHLCRNRSCVRPAHLEAVTPRENTLRGRGPSARLAMRTACDNGHPFDEANTGVRKDGGRVCRQCKRDTARAIYARKKEVSDAS